MGLINRINDVLRKNIESCSKNFKNSLALSGIKTAKLRSEISKYNESYDEQSQNAIYHKDLAYSNPVKFILLFLNKEVIQNALEQNPRIAEILDENKLSIEFDIENVNSIIMSHLIPTARTAQKMYCAMGCSKDEQNSVHLYQAALLHDIGKVFIPKEILFKKGKLNFKERAIIELHNILSYEILKTTDLHPDVAKLALEHHNYEKKNVKTRENQTLMIADVYCALREIRSYKKAINDTCAKAILYDMGADGKLDSRYIYYLN